MTPADDPLWQRWDEVDRLLDEALDRPLDQRVAYVTRRAAADPVLRDLVVRLLARLEEADPHQRVAGPAAEMWLKAFPPEDVERDVADIEDGTQVGNYVVIGRRGRGGMATVYEAERSDGAYQQRVALKVLRRGLDTDDLIRRFRTERQILSSLTHPNIARLLDGGALPDGRPYLVMELVDGSKITSYADSAGLDVTGRLELVVAVAGAVHAAHRRLIVHRDIKPSNILVDGDGQVKLLDFGIAKLLAADSGQTDAGARALTPDYASPEQIRGEPITTSTDVYQLGLLLRELLAGAKPPARQGGDLAIIISKALRDDPEERYASAEELAADIRRHLQGFPIHAHPESAGYRIRKFLGRNRWFGPVAAVVVAAVVGFMVTLSIQNRRIVAERDAARAATTRALATQDFLVDLLRSPDPMRAGQDRDITVVNAMQRGRGRVAEELSDQPELQAALLMAMGRTFTGLGRYEMADTLLRQALALHQSLHGEADPRTTLVLNAIGLNYRSTRDIAAADSVFQLEYRLRSGAAVPDTALARMLAGMSLTRRDLNDPDSALVLAGKAVALHRAAGDTIRDKYIVTLQALAFALRGADRLDSAETVYLHALDRQQRSARPAPLEVAQIRNNLGYLRRLREDYPLAEQHYREAVRLAAEALGEGHATTQLYSGNLAVVLENSGRIDEVVELGRRRIAAAEREWPEGHWRVGTAHGALGRMLLRNGRPDEAIAPLGAGVASYLGTLGAGHTWTVSLEAARGAALVRAGRQAEGHAVLNRAYGVLRRHPVRLQADERVVLTDVVKALEQGGDVEEAARFRTLLAPPE